MGAHGETMGFPMTRTGGLCRAAGSDREGGVRGSSCASQALLVTGSLDDFVSVAEAEVGSEHPLLVPKALEAFLELLDLGRDFGIVAV